MGKLGSFSSVIMIFYSSCPWHVDCCFEWGFVFTLYFKLYCSSRKYVILPCLFLLLLSLILNILGAFWGILFFYLSHVICIV